MRRRSVRILTARVLAASVALGGALLLSAMPAIADKPGTEPVSGDDRATAYAGNASRDQQGCTIGGLTGEVILFDDDPSGTYFDLPDIPEGFTLTGVVVKGGDAYNVYLGSESTTDLHAPLGPNDEPAGLSHWYACGIEDSQTTTTVPSSGETSSEETSTSETTSGETTSESTGTEDTTTSGAVGGGSEDDLADTGASVGPALWVAGGLLLLGGGLLVATRRRAFNGS